MVRMSFGKQCMNNKFVNSNSETLGYCRIIELGDQCNGAIIKYNKTTSSSNWLQNINIANALSGNIDINCDLNSSRTLFVTRNENNGIYQYFESDISKKQDKLVSGENIATINGSSLLEGGNINIQPDANVQAIEPAEAIDDIVTSKYIINTTDDNIVLTNYDYYRKTNVTSNITATFEINDPNIVTSYCLEFTTAENGTTVSLPSTIKWANGEMPSFENGFTYQISIVNGFGVCAKFK
jgi:hypothetical protein